MRRIEEKDKGLSPLNTLLTALWNCITLCEQKIRDFFPSDASFAMNKRMQSLKESVLPENEAKVEVPVKESSSRHYHVCKRASLHRQGGPSRDKEEFTFWQYVRPTRRQKGAEVKI